MIVKRNFSPLKVWGYIQNPTLFALAWSSVIWVIFNATKAKEMGLSSTMMGVLGSALAIFVAFRNQSAYARWWEARTLWSSILGASRVLGRLIITFADSHAHQPQYNAARSEAFKRRLVYACIAFVHSLRLQLRQQNDWEQLAVFFQASDFEAFQTAHNKPLFLQTWIGKRIYEAMADGTLGGFDSFQMEGQLLALANAQAGCERIKSTPLPRQYDFFTRVFVLLFALLLPFGLLGFFTSDALQAASWLIVPLSTLLSAVFIIMERTGVANEDPFENKITDVPLTYICNTIERDLREMLGETSLPAKLKPENGYLF